MSSSFTRKLDFVTCIRSAVYAISASCKPFNFEERRCSRDVGNGILLEWRCRQGYENFEVGLSPSMKESDEEAMSRRSTADEGAVVVVSASRWLGTMS